MKKEANEKVDPPSKNNKKDNKEMMDKKEDEEKLLLRNSSGEIAKPKLKLKPVKSRELRAGVVYIDCDCYHRNGLQQDCPRAGCGGKVFLRRFNEYLFDSTIL